MTKHLIDFKAEQEKTRAQENHLKGEDTLVLSCGESSLILHKDGTIELKGNRLLIEGHCVDIRGILNFN